MNRKTIKLFLWLTVFSISMAFLESAVVVYIRELYYPNGFSFPLQLMETKVALTEFFRELATLIMLFSIAIIAGKTRIERFAFFIFCFAIWDIFYYLFLEVIIAWPESFLTWDVLFLIPGIWTSPVIAPIINSLTMILISFVLIYFYEKNKYLISFKLFLIILVIGALIILIVYLREYYIFLLNKFSFIEILSMNTEETINNSLSFIPVKFNWLIYFSGVFLHILAISFFVIKNRKQQQFINTI